MTYGKKKQKDVKKWVVLYIEVKNWLRFLFRHIGQ